MNVEQRIIKLENLVNSLIKRTDNDKFYQNADTKAAGKTASDASITAMENESAILDEADVIDENSNAVLDLADYVAELEERVAALEGGQ